jgi:hypothetical protein
MLYCILSAPAVVPDDMEIIDGMPASRPQVERTRAPWEG